MSTSDFSATHSALGYYYQCLYALTVLLDADDENARVSLETYDDVTLEEGKDFKLHQVKHTLNTNKNLTLANEGLWKTLRIWSQFVASESLASTWTFIFVTCNTIAEDEWIQSLTEFGTDRTEAIATLEKEAVRVLADRAAAVSKREEAKKAGKSDSEPKALPHQARYQGCEEFLNLTKGQRQALVERIRLMPGTFSIADIQQEVESRLKKSVPAAIRSKVATRLIEWWDGRMAFSLLRDIGDENRTISKDELLRNQANLIAEFHKNKLTHPFESADPPTELPTDNNICRQIELVNGGNSRKNRATLVHWQAMNQRNQWISEDIGFGLT